MARHMKNMAQYSTGRHNSNRRSELPSNPKQTSPIEGVAEFEPLDEPESLFVGREPSTMKKDIPLDLGTETHEIGCGPDLNFIEV